LQAASQLCDQEALAALHPFLAMTRPFMLWKKFHWTTFLGNGSTRLADRLDRMK
jgi:hypothetical protein